MTDQVMEFLVASGGGSFDEVLARVPTDPKNVAEALTQLAGKSFVQSDGDKSIRDFYDLVGRVLSANGSIGNDSSRLRRRVLEEIVRREHGFMNSVVKPTALGLTFGLR